MTALEIYRLHCKIQIHCSADPKFSQWGESRGYYETQVSAESVMKLCCNNKEWISIVGGRLHRLKAKEKMK